MTRRAKEEALVKEGLAVLAIIARRTERRLGGLIPLDELMAAGRLALLEISRSYLPEKSRFAPYCAQRLKWALLDAVRRDTHGRVAASRARALRAAETFAIGHVRENEELGPASTDEDAEARLGALLAGHAAAMAIGLVTTSARLEEAPDPARSPEDACLESDLAAHLRALLAELPERDRDLLERHYWRDQPLEHAAKDLGISKSWASRLHAQAIVRLGKAMGPR